MNPVVGLSIGRILVGLLFFARPDVAGRLMGLDVKANPELAFGSRLFGSRDVALGALTLMSRGSTRRTLVFVGAAVDGADAGAAMLSHREKGLSTVPAALATGIALVAVVQGLSGLRTKKTLSA